MLYFDAYSERFRIYNTMHLLSPSTSSVFTVQNRDDINTLSYESIKFVKFSFFIALIHYDGPLIALRAIVTTLGVFLFKFRMKMISRSGKLTIPDRFSFNTPFILGLIPRPKIIEVHVRSNEATKIVKWNLDEGWNFSGNLGTFQRIDYGPPQQQLVCYNCNRNHDVVDCDLPNYTLNCKNCLVVSSEHENPCMPRNTISAIRSNLLANNALTLFQIVYGTSKTKMFYLKDGIFSELNANVKLVSGPSEGNISVQDLAENDRSVSFKQTQYRRCSFLFAILDKDGIWRLRFRGLVTQKHGLLCFLRLGFCDLFQFPNRRK